VEQVQDLLSLAGGQPLTGPSTNGIQFIASTMVFAPTHKSSLLIIQVSKDRAVHILM
jgi:hypothetical protein